MKPDAYIFDLDGTLADLTHRLHYVREPTVKQLYYPNLSGKWRPNWNKFFEACSEDILIQDVARLYGILRDMGYTTIICSGRSDVVYLKTIEWLGRNSIPFDKIFMRKQGDYRKDSIVKAEIFDNSIFPNYNVIGVFDDRDQVVEMWRSKGLRCYQVANGAF